MNTPTNILVLVSDAYGSYGGIAKFNRDLLASLCSDPNVAQVVAIPRLVSEPTGEMPDKLTFVVSASGGKLRFSWNVIEYALGSPNTPVIICGHIHLLPVAFIARGIMQLRRRFSLSLFRPKPTYVEARNILPPSSIREARTTIALVIHGTEAWKPTRSRVTNALVRNVNAVISVSNFTLNRFLVWAKPKHARSVLLPNCVDLSLFGPGPKRSDLMTQHRLEGRIVLMTMCRLCSQEQGWKGIDQVLEALPEIQKQLPHLSYLVVGDGTDRMRLEQKAARLNLQESVVFTGRVSEREKTAYYQLADAFVMAGSAEGFGIAYLEAMACGIPVIGSTKDASKETLRNGDLGIVVNPDNRSELYHGILDALQRPRFVPPELEEYSAAAFQNRCHNLVSLLTGRQH